MSSSNQYIPALERARAEGLELPDGEPIAQERWAALFVITTILRRRTWKEELVTHPNNVAHLSRSAPPVPQGYVTATYVTVEDVSVTGPCPDCVATPRVRKCRVCNGVGWV